jgi:hypothetical protein
MKRNHLLCASLLLSVLTSNQLSAQENILPETGNVGIGTTNPTEKLQVNGTARIDSMLVVKDSMIVQKGTILQDNLTVEGDLKLMGNSYFNQSIYYLNPPVLTPGSPGLRLLGTDASGMLKSLNFLELLHGDLLTCNPEPDGTYLPYWKTGTNKVYVDCPNTFVGINTINPTHNLHIIGDQLTTGAGQFQKLGVNTEPNLFAALNLRTGNYGAGLEINIDNPDEYTKALFIHANSPKAEIIKVVKDSDNPSIVRFMLNADGYMQIHNGTQKTLQLDTDGLLHARRIKVDVVSWPDYVFDPNYELPTIEEVADYIEENNHLPGIPDAATMEKDGIDLTETNKMLVEQVEEQMLYIIELKKELEALKVEIEALKEGE